MSETGDRFPRCARSFLGTLRVVGQVGNLSYETGWKPVLPRRFKLCAAVLAVGSLLLCGLAHAEQTIRFDFGSSRTTGTWNHVTEPHRQGVAVQQAVDAEGKLTGVGLELLEPWSGTNTQGITDHEDYPASATSDSFFLGDDDRRSTRLRLTGLSPHTSYTLRCFASRPGGTLSRRTSVRVGSQQAEFDPAADNNSVQLDHLQADLSGVLEVGISCVDDPGYAYLGILEIRGPFVAAEPQREPPDPLDGPPLVTAQAWAIADGGSGELLHGDQQDAVRRIASTTKILTAHLVFQLLEGDPGVLDEVVTVSMRAAGTRGSSAQLQVGDQLTVGDLLYGLLLPSGNDASVAIAEHFGPRTARLRNIHIDEGADGLELFVAAMNRRAAELKMGETRFFDPHGLGPNRSTAGELVRLAHTAMQDERFRSYVATRLHRTEITGVDGTTRRVVWRNTNRLLGREGFEGIKTGTTTAAGACLVSSGRRGEGHLLVVVLGSSSSDGRYIDTRNLFRWAWQQQEK